MHNPAHPGDVLREWLTTHAHIWPSLASICESLLGRAERLTSWRR